jgi:hypothetical protein
MARRRSGPTLIQRSRGIAPGQKADWHSVSGAGKSKVIREFFDLNEQDLETLALEMKRRISQRLASDVR